MYARSKDEKSLEQVQNSNQQNEKSVDMGSFVSKISLSNFRNYPYLKLDLPLKAKQVVLTGKNGVGKTNLIEAVSLLAPGKGLRQARFSEILLKQNQATSTAWGVRAVLENGNEEIELGTDFETVLGKRHEKRRIWINGAIGASQADLGEVCSAVWLIPAMDRLFSGDPASRRRFLDRLVQAFYQSHASACAAYQQALRQWNALLKDGRFDENWLTALEKTLGKYGAKICKARRDMVAILQSYLSLSVTSFPQADLSLIGGWEDELSLLSEQETPAFVAEKFKASRKLCAENGSVGGIHTVDFSAFYQEKNMPAADCSTGEQKALLISILLAHISAMREKTNTLPLVLFDEVTAHLDKKRQRVLFEEMKGLDTQVWFTGTEIAPFESLQETAHFVAVEDLLRSTPDWAVAS